MSTSIEGSPAPGDRFGPYRIVRELGRGGMGVVFEAVDSALQRRVALKVISPGLADDPAFRAGFTHEAQAMASLDSPHVVQVFSHGEAGGSLYIASQLIRDGDLGAIIRSRGALPPRLALDVVAQVASGLADAHTAGFVHRDVKPANVLVRLRGEDARAYLTDFGIAHRDGPRWAAGDRAVGTPAYLAPELLAGGMPGPATDIYALGCLLWVALAGRAPYSGASDDELIAAHLAAPVPQLPATEPWEREVNRVLRTAMAKHPSQRYPSAAALRDDVRRVLGAWPAPSPPRRSRTALVVGAAAVMLVVAGVVAGAVAVVALRGHDDSADPKRTASGSTHGSGLTVDERQAAHSIAAALEEDSDFDAVDARCTARKLVRRSGIEGLQEHGVIDSQVLSDIIDVGVSCVFESVTTPSGGPGG